MVITSVVSGDGSKTKEDKYMSSYKYKHLTLDDRITIQKALKEGQTFVEIGALIGKDPSTVSWLVSIVCVIPLCQLETISLR